MPDIGSSSPQTNPSRPASSSTEDIELAPPLLSAPIPARAKGGKSHVVKSGDKRADLNNKIRLFKQNVAKLHKAHQKLTRRAEKLENLERELDAKTTDLDARESALMEAATTDAVTTDAPLVDDSEQMLARAELELREAELERRAKALHQREADLNTQAITLRAEQETWKIESDEAKASAVAESKAKASTPNTNKDEDDNAKEQKLDALRQRLIQRSQELDQHELDLETRQQDLQPELANLDEERRAFRKEQGSAKRELTEREKAVAAEEQRLDEHEFELRAFHEEFDCWQEELDQFSAQIRIREQALHQRWEQLEHQADDVDRRTADLLNFEIVLDQRDHDISIREAALNQLSDSLESRQASLEQTKELIELRRQRVGRLHKQLARISSKLRHKRRRVRGNTNTLSIGPDDTEQQTPAQLEPSPSLDVGPEQAEQEQGQVHRLQTTVQNTDESDSAEPLTVTEKRALIYAGTTAILLGILFISSYFLAGAMTTPTWRATLVVNSGALKGAASLGDEELTESLNYLSDRGLRPAADVASFRTLLSERLTVTPTERGNELAFLDREPEMATFVMKGLQRGLEQQRGGSVQIVSAAAVDPQPFDDPRWRITYVLVAVGTLILLAGFIIVRKLMQRRA